MSKKARLDLLVKVRYSNPLPPPPFPPKLFNVPTDINRLGEPSYLSQLAASTPLPMLVDSEMGMPLNLNEFEGVWDGNDQSLNVVNTEKLDLADMALLAPSTKSLANESSQNATTTTEVSWMRTSNLFTRKAGSRRRDLAESRKEEQVDASEAAQIMAIDQTFRDLTEQRLEDLRHPDPKKKDLRVVESYDILPDEATWGNPYVVVRFPERPSAATKNNPTARASSPRLSRAILRPRVVDEDQVMDYLLPSDEAVTKFSEQYTTPLGNEHFDSGGMLEENPILGVPFDHVRSYELVSQKPGTKEVLLFFEEEEENGGDEGGEDPPRKRRKGVYYHHITFRTHLRKTRVKVSDEDSVQDQWTKAQVGIRGLQPDEEAQMDEAVSTHVDPTWVNTQLRKLHGGENAAEGQGEAIEDD